MKYVKEELEKLILVDKLSYREIGRLYGISDAYVKKISRNLGIILPIRSTFPINFKPANKGTGKTRNCKNCDKIILLSSSIDGLFLIIKIYISILTDFIIKIIMKAIA